MIPNLYKITDSIIVFNELDNRGFVSFYRNGYFDQLPEEMDALQIFEYENHSSTFFLKKLKYKRLGGIFNNQQKKVTQRIDELKEIDAGLVGEPGDYKSLCKKYGFGQLFPDQFTLQKNLKFSIDAIKFGEKYISSLVTEGQVESIPSDSLQVTLKFKEGYHKTIYVCGGDDRKTINNQLSKIKRELFLAGHSYFDPKRDRMVKVLSAAFPGNALAWEKVNGN